MCSRNFGLETCLAHSTFQQYGMHEKGQKLSHVLCVCRWYRTARRKFLADYTSCWWSTLLMQGFKSEYIKSLLFWPFLLHFLWCRSKVGLVFLQFLIQCLRSGSLVVECRLLFSQAPISFRAHQEINSQSKEWLRISISWKLLVTQSPRNHKIGSSAHF